ncbi:aspartate aminotransferase family protein [Jiulongibacter sediminis]|uniref:Aminotransferase class III n=1 Tax=Jiulongibacter sediminis TaxID=1605367 RepID=A0A0P7C4S8_9BACT|nr:aminotransferase class III-fold pyridoxal phosphate-dependent enzyme [Jiulongibacter sediminis]KPM49695.1 aminotransferase class III [Jiulongibacter sediminis]TBX26735.1 aminotransferase class III [Jiulongibacter sediminis]
MDLRQIFLNNIAQTSDSPLALEFVDSEGIYLIDKNGKKHIDLISGIAVSNMGHSHPEIVKAIQVQAGKYLHQMVYGEFVQSPQVKLASALIETLKGFQTSSGLSLDNVYFVNSGTEAVEGALKLAKRYTGRPEIISCFKAYHGSTHGALSLGDEDFKRNFRPLLPEIRKIERENFEHLDRITSKTAAVIIEVIGGESGVRVSTKEYLKAVSDKCKDVGALLIFDEIQSGAGRTGNFWAFEDYGVVPDILLSAKGLGGGMPIGAFIAPHELMNVFRDNPILGHITTFGGHPASCAAALASLEAWKKEIRPEEIKRKGELFKELLSKHPKIKEVRGQGLMLAAEIGDFDFLLKVIQKTIKNGVIADWFLYCDDSMRIAPPLIISDYEIRKACQVILKALDSVKE